MLITTTEGLQTRQASRSATSTAAACLCVCELNINKHILNDTSNGKCFEITSVNTICVLLSFEVL